MRKIFFFLIIFFQIFLSKSYSQIVYLDVQYIIDNSELGKFYKSKIQKIQEKNSNDLKIEKTLIKKKENEINNQKNILKKEEIDNKIKEINKLLKNYKSNLQKFNNEIIDNKKKYSEKILTVLNPILTSYVEKNKINLVIEKKNVLVGIKTLDITNQIMILLNEETVKKNLVNEN